MYTQTLHRIRLRLFAPNERVPDVTVRREDYLPDPQGLVRAGMGN